ncbi:hypothetical protein Tco_0366849, partial [Tanacetum coccineum]
VPAVIAAVLIRHALDKDAGIDDIVRGLIRSGWFGSVYRGRLPGTGQSGVTTVMWHNRVFSWNMVAVDFCDSWRRSLEYYNYTYGQPTYHQCYESGKLDPRATLEALVHKGSYLELTLSSHLFSDVKKVEDAWGFAKGSINALPEVLQITKSSGLRILTRNRMYHQKQELDSIADGMLMPLPQLKQL